MNQPEISRPFSPVAIQYNNGNIKDFARLLTQNLVVPFAFHYTSVNASLSNVQLLRSWSSGFQGRGAILPVEAAIVGLTLHSEPAGISAGSLTVTALVNHQTDPACQLVWTPGDGQQLTVTFDPDQVEQIDPGTHFALQISTSGSYAPTTNDIEVIAYLLWRP